VLTTMLVVAVVLVIVSVPIGSVLVYLIPITDAILITLGVLLLAGRNPFARMSGIRVPFVASPFGRAYLYGLLLGPLALPCAGAFALALVAYSVGLADTAQKILVFVVYGLGFGLPLVVLSLLAGTRQQQIVRFVTRHHRTIDVIAGVLLIAVGIGDLLINLDSIRQTLGV
jgi:cytochrome c-type biogenesis protein